MDQFIGEIRVFPFNFAPRGWALCNGQLMAISSNTALFSILGVAYGGDGRTTFALPNLMGRVVPGVGRGPGLSEWDFGQVNGEAQVTLLESEMPAHNHLLMALNNAGTTGTPEENLYLAKDVRGGGGTVNYMAKSEGLAPNTMMSPMAVMPSGGDQPHENCQPYLAFNFCIAVSGEFPARN
jgi:microcystin-dependent protein